MAKSTSTRVSKTINPVKRKSQGFIAFDEINCTPIEAKKSKAKAIPQTRSASIPVGGKEWNLNKLEEVKEKRLTEKQVKRTTAKFTEGQQEMQMAVDDQEDDMFETESSDSDPDVSDEELDCTGDVSALEQMHSDSEAEINPNVLQGRNSDNVHKQQMDKLDLIDQEMQLKKIELHDKMEESGLHGAVNLLEQLFDKKPGEDKPQKRKLKDKVKSGMTKAKNLNDNRTRVMNNVNVGNDNTSEATIYRNAVQNRTSSSSEDGLDLSDESNMLNTLLLDDGGMTQSGSGVKQPQPLCSVRQQEEDEMPQEQGDKMVRLSERAKASLFPPQCQNLQNNLNANYTSKQFVPKDVTLIDQDYVVVSGHVDPALQEKIVSGQYVDFGKLLPKDRVSALDDSRMELVVRNGKAFWVPISDGVSINNFAKWEQAFRVYANIYAKAHQEHAGELIEYNHVIHSISLSFAWDNVYAYDCDFRLHLARHPDRSWSIILQQAWAMRLCDRIYHNKIENQSYNHTQEMPSHHHKEGTKSSDYFKRFNKGKCNLGKACRYEHRCLYCNKFGHGVIICRKLIFDRDKSGSGGKRNNGHQTSSTSSD